MGIIESMNQILSSIWWGNILLVFLVIFFYHGDPRTTAFWAMIMTFIPGIGFILYLFFGQDYKKRNLLKLKKRQDERVQILLKHQRDDLQKGRYIFQKNKTKEYQDLVLLNMTGKESFYTENNDVSFYFNGKDKFKALFDDLKNAKESIDLQYYIFKKDKIGQELLSILEKKAKEGVKVRVIYDAVGGRFITLRAFRKLIDHGGKVAKFFPGFIFGINLRINYRNHRKLTVIDDKIGYIGGFNIGDEYYEGNKRFPYWRDTHMRIQGDAIWGLKISFLKDWYYAFGDKTAEEIVHHTVKSSGKAGVQIVTSGPDTQLEHIKYGIIRMIHSAKDKIIIQTPYFVPDESVKDALISALYSGVKVLIMIPSKPDHLFVHPASMCHLGELLKHGAKGYLYEKGFLHAKTMIIDDYISTVGSANMDMRSFSLNFEANAFIYDKKATEELFKQFILDVKDSKKVKWEDYVKRGRWDRVKEAISRLLSPIL